MSSAGDGGAPSSCCGLTVNGEPPPGASTVPSAAAMPKSASRGVPSFASSTFDGLRSRCTMPWACSAASPSATPASTGASSRQGRPRRLARSPRARCANTAKTGSPSCTSRQGCRFGCDNDCCRRAEARNRPRSAGVAATRILRTLSVPSTGSRACQTCAARPSASLLSSAYRAARTCPAWSITRCRPRVSAGPAGRAPAERPATRSRSPTARATAGATPRTAPRRNP